MSHSNLQHSMSIEQKCTFHEPPFHSSPMSFMNLPPSPLFTHTCAAIAPPIACVCEEWKIAVWCPIGFGDHSSFYNMRPIVEIVDDSAEIWNKSADTVTSPVSIVFDAKALKSLRGEEKRKVVEYCRHVVRVAVNKQNSSSNRNRGAGRPHRNRQTVAVTCL